MNFFFIAAIAGSLFSGLNTVKAGKLAKKLHNRNALILEQRAVRSRKIAREKARQRRTEGSRLRARQVVLYAKSGLAGAGRGTRRLVGDETTRRIERQAGILQERGAFEFDLLTEQARQERKFGRDALRTSKRQAFASLATGLGGAGMDFYRFRESKKEKEEGFTNEQAVFGAP